MKLFLLSISLFASTFCFGQTRFDHEKEVANITNYNSEEINFKVLHKKDSIQLSGTLLSPKTPSEIVIIIVPGSGADTRNSHYSLTEKLLENNISVYRYDERGIGKSEGKFNSANYTITAMSEELSSCILALKKNKFLSGKKIGLLGHSQGGLVTMQTFEKGLPINFMVQWATPVQKHGEFIKYQIKSGQNPQDDVFKFENIDKKIEIITALNKVVEENKELDDWKLSKKIDKESKKIGYTKSNYTRFPYLTLSSEKDIVRKNFEPAYQKIKIPVFYIAGSNDTYVDSEAETKLLESFSNSNITIKKMNGLNHYLGSQKLTLQNLYEIDKNAASEIVNWIKIR